MIFIIKYHTYIITSVVLYEYESWSLTLNEEHQLNVLENGCWEEYSDPGGSSKYGKEFLD